MEGIDFEKFFKIQTIGMKMALCHPDTKHNAYWLLKSILIYGPYTLNFFFLCNSVLIDIRKHDYFNAFRNCVPVTIYICIVFEYIMLIKHRKTIGKLIKLMRDDFDKIPNLETRSKRAIFKHINNSTWIMKNWLVLMFCSVWIFIIKGIILSVYYAVKGEFRLVPFHDMYYTDYIDRNRDSNWLIFAGTYMMGINYTCCCTMIYLCALPLGPIFMLHVCGLLELIIIKFEDVFEKDNVNERLIEIVKDLQYAYRFVADINTCFTFMYEVMLKQTMILLPVISYAIVKSIGRGEFTIEYITVFVAIISMSTPCYYSDKLMSKGEEVRQAAYACGWERVFIPEARKTLLIILTRALKPITIKSIFHNINLDTLADVYRQAYTIFNLMSTMWN
uniref:Odorant receptor n=1 Tax=Dendrolimus kikuchii TaxID=765133 RepID=A0A076E9C5_9NEOP|nr:odorant receptor [Dendrolimus kikuchii]